MFDFTDQVVMLTGASGNLGRAVARAFYNAGARLVLADRRPDELPAVLPGLAVGVAFEAFAGCDRTFATCQSKFGNSLNFGGFPWIPAKNPFAGDSIV